MQIKFGQAHAAFQRGIFYVHFFPDKKITVIINSDIVIRGL